MGLERTIVQELPYPRRMDWNLVESWADGIPVYSENDPEYPEWKATPIIPIETPFGTAYVKNESNRLSNPTGTIKDRPAWEMACLYRDFARNLWLQRGAGTLGQNIESIEVPRLTYVTAGNVGLAFANRLKQHGLPPMKLLVNASIPLDRLNMLKGLHADIYMADLSARELSPEEIKASTNNPNGVDITSVRSLELVPLFYDWHVHEAFNENPDEIFTPAGSLALMGCYLFNHQRNARIADPRLKIPINELSNISVLGATPYSRHSIADKLTSDYLPFAPINDTDVSALKTF